MELTRDAKRVFKHLHLQDNGSTITDAPCKIHVPVRFQNKDLAILGSEVFIVGFYAIIMNDAYYGVDNTIAMMQIRPSSTKKVTVRGTDYFEFSFEPGDVVFVNNQLVVNDTLTYYLYDELVAKGNIPWFMNYYDMAKMFDTASLHAGVNLGSRAILELIISTTARDKDDLTRLYRHILNRHEDVVTNPPKVIPFRSVVWNTSDTTSRLNGAYFADAINTAVVNPSESVELIEEILRT
ncbi:hypothetical protein D3C87_1179130 [compost metagenome]